MDLAGQLEMRNDKDHTTPPFAPQYPHPPFKTSHPATCGVTGFIVDDTARTVCDELKDILCLNALSSCIR
jgi:hypothetical protein